MYKLNFKLYKILPCLQMDVMEQERQAAAVEQQMTSMLEECMILFEAVGLRFIHSFVCK